MPIYDIECKKCGYTEEILVKPTEADKQQECSKCGGPVSILEAYFDSKSLDKWCPDCAPKKEEK